MCSEGPEGEGSKGRGNGGAEGQGESDKGGVKSDKKGIKDKGEGLGGERKRDARSAVHAPVKGGSFDDRCQLAMRLTQDVQFDKRRDLRHIDYVLRKPYADVADHYVMHGSKLGSGQFGVIRPCMEISTGAVFACKSIHKKCIKVQYC